MKIKWWMLALFGVGCLLIGSIIGVAIPRGTQLNPPPITPTAVESEPDIPRYTADQVIAVGKGYSPDIKNIYSTWSAIYQGNGLWLVSKTVPGKTVYFYFYEPTGQIQPAPAPVEQPKEPTDPLQAFKDFLASRGK